MNNVMLIIAILTLMSLCLVSVTFYMVGKKAMKPVVAVIPTVLVIGSLVMGLSVSSKMISSAEASVVGNQIKSDYGISLSEEQTFRLADAMQQKDPSKIYAETVFVGSSQIEDVYFSYEDGKIVKLSKKNAPRETVREERYLQ